MKDITSPSAPVKMPFLYAPPPYDFKAEFVCAVFSVQPEKVKPLVPDIFPLYEQCLCSLWIVNYLEAAGLGRYYECMFLVSTSFEGKSGVTCPSIFVTTDVSLCCGREVWGFPKRLSEITLTQKDTIAEGFSSHPSEGNVRLRLKNLKRTDMTLPPPPRVYLLRHIPSPQEDEHPLQQVITVRMKNFILTEYFSGDADMELTGNLSVFSPSNILYSFYGKGSWTLTGGRIIKDFSKHS